MTSPAFSDPRAHTGDVNFGFRITLAKGAAQSCLTSARGEQLCVFGEAQDGGLGSVTDSGLGRGE